MRDAGVATIAAADLLSAPASAGHRRRPGGRTTVAIFGGGVAGLTVAHELAERGFRVAIYERRTLGGKARSIPVPGTGGGGRRPLPGEHGWRTFFGFYRNLPQTLRRIPRPGGGSVHDNLLAVDALVLAYPSPREDVWIPRLPVPDPGAYTIERAARELVAAAQFAGGLSASDAQSLAQKLLVFFSSCDERRLGQWEHMSWWDYIEGDRHSTNYRGFLNVLPRAVALRPKLTSARTVGAYYESGIWSFFTDRGNDGAPDQVLNGPTSDTWIEPWANYLRSLGVRIVLGHAVDELTIKHGRIVSARVHDGHGRHRRVDADWFICCLPVERARRLWTKAILNADPSLESMSRVPSVPCNGMQFYLRKPVPIVPGHYVCVDSPWAVATVSQAQFWRGDFSATYGNGQQRDCVSVYISEFEQPGTVVGKTAQECSPAEFAREVWEQIKQYVNKPGRTLLRDEDLDSWFIDPGVKFQRTGRAFADDDPMFVNPVGGWADRPDAHTAIPNLFLASDYVRTQRDAATMESANEAGRNAANALLAATSSRAERATVLSPFQPPEFEALKRIDAERYKHRQPNLLETPLTRMQTAKLLSEPSAG